MDEILNIKANTKNRKIEQILKQIEKKLQNLSDKSFRKTAK